MLKHMNKFTFYRPSLGKIAPTPESLTDFLTHAPAPFIKRAYDAMIRTNWRGHYVFSSNPQEALFSMLTPRINIRAVCAWSHLNYNTVCGILSRNHIKRQHGGVVVSCIDDIMHLAPKNATANSISLLKVVFSQLEYMLNTIGSIIMEWRHPAYFECQELLDRADDQYYRAIRAKASVSELVSDAVQFCDTSSPEACAAQAFAKQAAHKIVVTHTNYGQKYLTGRDFENCYFAANDAVHDALRVFAKLNSQPLSFMQI